MPHTKSTIKRLRSNSRQEDYNTHYKSTMKTTSKKLLSIKEKEVATAELRRAYSLLDKLARKKIIHKNKAANQKAKLTRYVNSLP